MKEGPIGKVKLALLTMQRHSWEQGVAAQAFLELGEIETALLLAREAVLRQSPDGRLAMMDSDDQVTDPAASGEALLAAARFGQDPALQAAADRMLNYLLQVAPRAADGTLYHLCSSPQVWVDSFYMAPPFLAAASQPDEAVRQIEGLHKRLWDPGKKLYSHIWDDGRQAFIRQAAWGVGNGWAAAGLARVIRQLPADRQETKDHLAGYARELIDGCLAHGRPDGLFHDVIDDPSSFVETNLAQMLAYAIYRGIQGGWLDRGYHLHADRMRAAAARKVDEHGLVQAVCGAPNFDHPGTAPEGQAFFLLMEAALRDLEQAPGREE